MRALDLAPRRPGTERGLPRPAYSRFVGLMKWGLPALAGFLVVLVLAWPGVLKRNEGFQLSFSGLRGLGEEELTMLNPRFMGVDRKNQPFVITADSANQDPADPRLVTLDSVQADITLTDGSWLSLVAASGLYRQAEQTLTLEGPVSIYSDSGYELHLRRVEATLAEGVAWSDDGVEGQGPFGQLRADRMRIENQGERMFFEGRVRLTVLPGAKA
jgi:lipopolysaccharide export system protein LptC